MNHVINDDQLNQMTKNIQAIVDKHLGEECVLFGLFLKRHKTSIEYCGQTQFKDLYILFKKEQKKEFKDGNNSSWVFYSESLPKKRGEYKYWIAECLDMNKSYKGSTKREVMDLVIFNYGKQENK